MNDAERASMEPEDAMAYLLQAFHKTGEDAAAVMDRYELRLTTDAISRAAYTTAARAWREDVVKRLDALEEAAANLIQRDKRPIDPADERAARQATTTTGKP